MFRKLKLGLVAAACLGGMALAPTAASAKPWGGGGKWGGGFGGWGYHHHYFGGVGLIGVGDDGCYVTQRVMTPFGPRLRTVNVCY
jgi:hypothetical protein